MPVIFFASDDLRRKILAHLSYVFKCNLVSRDEKQTPERNLLSEIIFREESSNRNSQSVILWQELRSAQFHYDQTRKWLFPLLSPGKYVLEYVYFTLSTFSMIWILAIFTTISTLNFFKNSLCQTFTKNKNNIWVKSNWFWSL